MPTTIYDASQITQRRMNKAQSGDFINRIQNYANPNTGYAPSRGVFDQSIINNVKDGNMKYYRKQNDGITTVNNGCPCVALTGDCQTN